MRQVNSRFAKLLLPPHCHRATSDHDNNGGNSILDYFVLQDVKDAIYGMNLEVISDSVDDDDGSNDNPYRSEEWGNDVTAIWVTLVCFWSLHICTFQIPTLIRQDRGRCLKRFKSCTVTSTTFVALCILVYLLQCTLGMATNFDITEKFAFYPERILNYKEYYRFLTSAFLHSGMSHIGWNLLSTHKLGKSIELLDGSLALLEATIWAFVLEVLLIHVLFLTPGISLLMEGFRDLQSYGFSGIVYFWIGYMFSGLFSKLTETAKIYLHALILTDIFNVRGSGGRLGHLIGFFNGVFYSKFIKGKLTLRKSWLAKIDTWLLTGFKDWVCNRTGFQPPTWLYFVPTLPMVRIICSVPEFKSSRPQVRSREEVDSEDDEFSYMDDLMDSKNSSWYEDDDADDDDERPPSNKCRSKLLLLMEQKRSLAALLSKRTKPLSCNSNDASEKKKARAKDDSLFSNHSFSFCRN